jgi:hypothetical protein
MFFLKVSTRHHIPFFPPYLFFYVNLVAEAFFVSWVTKLSKPAGSHCGVDGDADGWPDQDLPCSRDASFHILKGLSTEILFKSLADKKWSLW